ncbi:MAG: hypothetical protein ACYCO9_21805 [Streptosporangiaceae bacterium]
MTRDSSSRPAARARRRQRARAARQALALCEHRLPAPSRTRTARAALLAAGLPPRLAGTYRHRLRIQTTPETEVPR